jgi:hypothetical protein
MTIDRAGFLRRWSERKLAAQAESQQPAPAETIEEAEAAEPFDPATLPSIDSLTADSDYTAFLRPGVPAALTNAALRQAWLSDPLISTFKEMADYDWDFNAPGYGALRPTDDVQALLSRVINRPEPEPEPEPKPEQEPKAAPEVQTASNEPIETEEPTKNFVAPPVAEIGREAAPISDFFALQHEEKSKTSLEESSSPMLRRPRHGGALPS